MLMILGSLFSVISVLSYLSVSFFLLVVHCPVCFPKTLFLLLLSLVRCSRLLEP